MADDHAPAPQTPLTAVPPEPDTFLRDLERRRPVPESLRYPETDEAYDRMIDEAEASGYIPAEEVQAWIRSLGTANPLPRPRGR